ncbi:hypothetical protein [Novosphingobium lindaniclasticum]
MAEEPFFAIASEYRTCHTAARACRRGVSMRGLSVFAGWAVLASTGAAHAAEPPPPAIPTAISPLQGCWEGTGEVMKKPVTIALVGKPVALRAILTVDAESHTIADPADRYSAHLVFGGAMVLPGSEPDLVGYWADSFGGAMTASGSGSSRPDGFDMSYQYEDGVFLNHWRFDGEKLSWMIVSQDQKKGEEAFASYTLTRVKCRAS